MRYFLEIIENRDRIPVGPWQGYATLEEAEKASLDWVDDALPQNKVRVMGQVGVAYFGGDGESYYRKES